LKKALSGLRAWIVQRFTAVYMLFFCVFALLHFVLNPPHSYFDWRGWVSSPFVMVTTALFFVALLVHAWVGLRDVVMDYVNPLPLRITVLATLLFILIGLALRIMQILLLASP
jgi:succinate dehydrogenase / fumarate reductase membrane anchor subunit